MKAFVVVIATLIAVASAQYDYQPPQRKFNAGGSTERPIYGVPNHTPGEPIGPSHGHQMAQVPAHVAAPAPVFTPAPVSSAPAFSQPPTYSHQPQGYPQQAANGFSQHANGFSQQAQGYPQQAPISGPAPVFQQQPQEQEQQAEAYTPKVYRHVYVHSAPDEPEDVQSRTVKIPGGDKHVNIIFVKTPTQSSSQQTEVILPEQDEHKSLVYVLLKKGENTADVKIRKPAPAPQKKPEVYFIRYNQAAQQNGGGYQQQQPQQQQQQQQQSSSGAQSQQGYPEQAPLGIRVPSPIRTPADVPSSGYGLPL